MLCDYPSLSIYLSRLCKELEDPGNTERWNALPGVMPDAEELQKKIAMLQERLDQKKELLLEKELMLEEVTNLTTKLRHKVGWSNLVMIQSKIYNF
jgi:hypothetical protein